MEAAALLHCLALQVGRLSEGSRLLEGNESLVAVVIAWHRGVQEAVEVEVEAGGTVFAGIFSVAGVDRAENVDLTLRGSWGGSALRHRDCLDDRI